MTTTAMAFEAVILDGKRWCASTLWVSVAGFDVGVFEDAAHGCLAGRGLGKFGGDLVQSEEFDAERHELPAPFLDGFGLANDHLTDVWAGDFTPFSKIENLPDVVEGKI